VFHPVPVRWQAVCVNSSPTGIQRTVRRLDEDVTVIVDSLIRIEATQDAHTVAIDELRSDVTELRSDVTQLRSDVTQLQTGMTELQSGMSEVLTLLRGGQAQN
jgi:hypothetical protein